MRLVCFAGQSWQDKLKLLREDMNNSGVGALVLTALDEIAWTFNLRGNDVPFTPVFRSYAVLKLNEALLYAPMEKITEDVRAHLNSTKANYSVR